MQPQHIEGRLALIEGRVADIDREVQRTRSRIHDLEGDRATIGLLTERLANLHEALVGVRNEIAGIREDVGQMRGRMVGLALSIAGSAVVALFSVLIGTGKL